MRGSQLVSCPGQQKMAHGGEGRKEARVTKRDAVLAMLTKRAARGGAIFCKWFVLCRNAPTGTMPHPVLGDVPICDRCRKIAERDGA